MAFDFSPGQIEALRLLDEAFAPTPWVLIGSVAIACQMEWTRETQDMDITVAIDVADVQNHLDSLPHSSESGVPEHRWITPQGVKVDLIPAGPGAIPRNSLRWPISGNIMSITGMHLAFKYTLPYQITDDLVIQVAQLRVILLLKMVAYLEHPYEREKDLQDIATIISYQLPHDDERRWASNIIDRLLDYEHVSALVMGRELGEIIGENETLIVQKFAAKVRDDSDADTTQFRLARFGPSEWRSNPDKMLKYIDEFMLGIADH